MNPNHNDMQPNTEPIDRLVHQGQASGIPVADDLARTMPLADRGFQQSLEDRLVELLQNQPTIKGDEQLTAVTVTPTRAAKRLSYIPLTLAAAMLALVLVSGILFTRGSQSPDPNAAAAGSTIAPTPEPTINIVVALQNLPRGFQFPAALDELANFVGYAPWPASAVPPNTLTESQGGLGQLPGRILGVDLRRDQPIIATYVVDDLTQLDAVSGVPVNILPSDRVAVSVPTALIGETEWGIGEGDRIDIKATFSFTGIDENFQTLLPPPENVTDNFSDLVPSQDCSQTTPCSITQTIIRDSIILHIGPLPEGKWIGTSNEVESDDADIITLSVTPEEAPLLVWLIEANIPLTLELAAPPRDFVPVVIAAQPLSWGDQVMPGQVIVVYWPPDRVPDGAIDDPSLVSGKYLTRRVEQWQPVFPDDLADESPYQPGQIPDGMVVTTLIPGWIANDVSGLAAGDNVDITIAFLNSPTDGGCEACNMLIPEYGWMEIKLLFTDVKVFGLHRATTTAQGESLSVILPIEDVMLLNWLSMATRPTAITVTRSGQREIPTKAVADGRVSLRISRSSVANSDEAAGLVDQGIVSILATLNFRGFDPSDPMTYVLEGSGAAAVILAENAEISSADDSTYTLTVSPEDLPMLQWALAANLPLTIAHIP